MKIETHIEVRVYEEGRLVFACDGNGSDEFSAGQATIPDEGYRKAGVEALDGLRFFLRAELSPPARPSQPEAKIKIWIHGSDGVLRPALVTEINELPFVYRSGVSKFCQRPSCSCGGEVLQ